MFASGQLEVMVPANDGNFSGPCKMCQTSGKKEKGLIISLGSSTVKREARRIIATSRELKGESC